MTDEQKVKAKYPGAECCGPMRNGRYDAHGSYAIVLTSLDSFFMSRGETPQEAWSSAANRIEASHE
jgi:hypothetical protein